MGQQKVCYSSKPHVGVSAGDDPHANQIIASGKDDC